MAKQAAQEAPKDELEIEIEAPEPADETIIVDEKGSRPASETKNGKAVVAPVATDGANTENVDDVLAGLKRQLEESQAQKRASDQRAMQATAVADQARTEAHKANVDFLKGSVESLTRERDVLKGQLAAAFAAQDHAAAADIQYALSETAAKLTQIQYGKEQLEKSPPKPLPPQALDPVEQFAAQLTPRAASWIRAHPQFVTDPRMNRKLIAAHNLAEADGAALDSDEYFGHVENTLGLTRAAPVQQEQESPMSSASQPAQRRASPPPAAPASRSGNGNGAPSPRTVRLSAEEVEIAGNMGMTKEEYAKNKILLQKEGRLN